MLISVLSVSFVLAADARPGKPKLVYAGQVSGGLGVLLAWSNDENTRKTEVYRSKNGGSYKKVGENSAKDSSYKETKTIYHFADKWYRFFG